MNVTLIGAFLRQRFTSPMRLALLVLFTLFPLGGAAIMGTLEVFSNLAGPIAILLAAGAIGQDVSSGTLQLLLVRPVTRPSYVLNRWLAAVMGAVGIVCSLLVLGTLIMFLRGTPPTAMVLVRMLLEAVSDAAGTAAVIVALSSLVGGLGDLALYFGSMIVLQMLNALAMFKHWDWLARACSELNGVLSPDLSFAWLSSGLSPSPFMFVSFASTVTLALAVAITRLNRRELSYASE